MFNRVTFILKDYFRINKLHLAWTNYHSHTHFCDGSDKPEQYIAEAINLNLAAYGYSSHAPVNFETVWCIPDNKLNDYIKEIKEIKEKYSSDIQIYHGLEIDFIPGIAGRSKHLMKELKLDFFIGSVHFAGNFADGSPWNIDHTVELFEKGLTEIFRNNFLKASEKFYDISKQMIVEDKPDVIGHLDKIKMYNNKRKYFSESDKFYRNQVLSVLEVIKKSGSIVEVNTRGYYRYGQLDLYPSQWIIEKLAVMDIPVMLNSDSHKPEEIIGGFEYAIEKLKEAGVKRLWALIDDCWQGFEYNRQGLIL